MTPVANHGIADMTEGVATLLFTLPSGNTILIREQNGEDDDVLSSVKDNRDGTALHRFVAGITKEYNGVPVTLGIDDVKSWKLRDKYYTILKSRRLSLGDLIYFDHEFVDGITESLVEDLSTFDTDFSKATPVKKGEKGYDAKLPQAYPSNETTAFHKLSSGKEISYEFLTGVHEARTLRKTESTLTLNDKLRFRDFKLKIGGAYQLVDRFNMFSARDMHEIRTHVEENDTEFILLADCKNPRTGVVEPVSLFAVSDFFFPVG